MLATAPDNDALTFSNRQTQPKQALAQFLRHDIANSCLAKGDPQLAKLTFDSAIAPLVLLSETNY